MLRFTPLPANLSLREPSVLIATWFGAGLLPKVPGTWGSLAALPFAWVLHDAWGRVGLIVAAGLLFAIGVWAAAAYVRRGGNEDPGAVVVDEVVGQWLVLAVASQPSAGIYVAGFLLFRAFDILKPWPISWVDRKIKGGFGTMLDDVAAGCLAALLLWASMRTVPGLFS